MEAQAHLIRFVQGELDQSPSPPAREGVKGWVLTTAAKEGLANSGGAETEI